MVTALAWTNFLLRQLSPAAPFGNSFERGDSDQTFHGFVRAAVFLPALTTVSVLVPSLSTTVRIISCFSVMILRVLVFCTFLTDVPCQASCPDLPLQTASANHQLRLSFNVFVFSADSSCKMTTCAERPSFCTVSSANFALNHFVDDNELCQVSVSL